MINVILIEKIEKLGKVGDVVTVKPGYARNFLLPQKKALRATKDNITLHSKKSGCRLKQTKMSSRKKR